MIFSVDETIEAPVVEVWRHLTEPPLMERWMTGIDNLRSQDGGPLSTDSRLLFTARGNERCSNVVAYHPCERITLQSIQGQITTTYTYEVRPAATDGLATRVTLDANCVAEGIAWIFTPVLRPLIRKADGGQLERLKMAITRM